MYFDDFKVEHVKSPVIQSQDYYPFGLNFNNFSRENSINNLYQYNGKELQDELSLGWYDYLARQYDPILGRFLSVDPLGDLSRRWSPYSFAFNSPIRFTDPDGMLPEDEVERTRKLEVTSSKSSDKIKETRTASATATRTVRAGSKEYARLLGKSTMRGNPLNGIGDIQVIETMTETIETVTEVEYDGDGNVVSRSPTSETTTTTTTTSVVVEDVYGGTAGGFSETESSTVASKSPTPSNAMSGLINEAVNYRAENGVSITNRDEYAGRLAAQQRAVQNWDDYATWGQWDLEKFSLRHSNMVSARVRS